MRHSHILVKSIASLFVLAASAVTANAITQTWDGGLDGLGNDLGVAANWSGDALPLPGTPDTAEWNGTVAGPLSLIYSGGLAGTAGNLGVTLSLAAAQTSSVSIDATSTTAIRMAGITIAAGAGAFTLGDGTGTFNVTLGGSVNSTQTFTNNSTNAAVINSDVVFGNGGGNPHTYVFTGSGNWTLNNVLGAGLANSALTRTGTGTLTLNGANSGITGAITVGANVAGQRFGVVRAAATQALGTGTITVGPGGNDTSARLEIAGGSSLSNAISLPGRNNTTVAIQNISGNNTLSGNISMGTGGGAYITQSDAGLLTLAGTITNSGGGSRVFTLQGAGNGIVSGVINNGTGTTSLTKAGAGTWTLTGASIYTGATTVNGGTLITTPLQTGATTVTVADGARFGVRLNSAGSTFAATTLTTGTTTGATLLMDTGALGNPTAPVINATTFTPTAATVINLTGSALSVANDIPLLDYTGSLGGLGFAGLSVALPARTLGNLVDNTVDTRVDLNITQIEQVKWRGNTSANWDADTDGTGTNGTQNWQTTVNLTATKYLQGTGGTDAANFTDSATGSTDVNIAVPVTPLGTVFNNSTLNYTLSSTGGFGIGGGGSLSKSGTGSVTLNTPNTYTGGTVLNAGTLNLGHASALGIGAVTINGGTIANSAGTPLVTTVVGPLNVNADFTASGTGDLDLGNGAVTVAGAGTTRIITVDSIALAVGEIKAAAHGLDKQGSGTLVVGSVGNDVAASVIAGTLNVGAGTLQINRTGTVAGTSGDFTATGLTGTGTITNGAAVERWLFVNSTSDSTFSGSLTNGGIGGLGLNKQGTGILTLSGTHSYTGATTVGGGALVVTGSLGSTAINITAGTLSLQAANAYAPGVARTLTLGPGGVLDMTVDNAITGLASIALQQSITLSRPNNYQGDTIINAGVGTTVTITNPLAVGTGRLNAATGATNPAFLFRIDGGGIISMPNSFGGNSGITTTIDVNNNGSGTNGIIQLNGLGIYGNGTLNVTGGNGYSLVLGGLSNTAGAAGTTVLNPTTATLSVGTYSSASNSAKLLQLDGTNTGNAITGAITNGTNVVSLAKANSSTWTLSGDSTYTGATTVTGGTLVVSGTLTGTVSIAVTGGVLQLGAANRLNDLATITLGGGTLNTGGFGETLSVATVTAASTLDLGTGSSVVQFADSSAVTWTGPLSILNWSGSATDQVFFGSSNTALGPNIGFIQFVDPAGYAPGIYGAEILSTGEVIVAVPEPTAALCLLGGLGILGGLRRPRRTPGAPRI